MKKRTFGFTLVELLVVVAIIGILATVGLVVFKGVGTGAKDAKIKADIDAISKVLESRYNAADNTYPAWDSIEAGAFTSGSKPKDPAGNDYPDIDTGDRKSFIACAVLSDKETRYCRSSTFGPLLRDPVVYRCLTVPALENGISGCRLVFPPTNVVDNTIYTDCPSASESRVIDTLLNCSDNARYLFWNTQEHKIYTTQTGNISVNQTINGQPWGYNYVGTPRTRFNYPITIKLHVP